MPEANTPAPLQYVIKAKTDAGDTWIGPFTDRNQAKAAGYLGAVKDAYKWRVLTHTQALKYSSFKAAIQEGTYPNEKE